MLRARSTGVNCLAVGVRQRRCLASARCFPDTAMPFDHESDRVQTLIRTLNLVPHPEGGWFRRTFRSALDVRRTNDRARRAALTAIVYLLPGGEISRWHRIGADETWHHYEGAEIQLLDLDPESGDCNTHRLGPVGEDSFPQRTIAAGHWQAARAPHGYALMGCSVAPGFDFKDYIMLVDDPALAQRLLQDEDQRALL